MLQKRKPENLRKSPEMILEKEQPDDNNDNDALILNNDTTLLDGSLTETIIPIPLMHTGTMESMDYAKDICKDYNETGFCGYGDSCKFLHERGDFQASWQLDLAYQQSLLLKNNSKKKDKDDGDGDGDSRCSVCNQVFLKGSSVAMSGCSHLFCTSCCAKRRVCPICHGSLLNGGFVIRKL